MVQLSATRCSCIAILWVSLVSFAATTLYVASQRRVYFCKRIFRYRFSPETFGYTLVYQTIGRVQFRLVSAECNTLLHTKVKCNTTFLMVRHKRITRNVNWLYISHISTSAFFRISVTFWNSWIHLDILVSLLEWGIGPSQGLYLHRRVQHGKKKRGHTSIPRARFEPTFPVFEPCKIYAPYNTARSQQGSPKRLYLTASLHGVITHSISIWEIPAL
jgi:hypothetical protein